MDRTLVHRRSAGNHPIRRMLLPRRCHRTKSRRYRQSWRLLSLVTHRPFCDLECSAERIASTPTERRKGTMNFTPVLDELLMRQIASTHHENTELDHCLLFPSQWATVSDMVILLST